MAANASAGKILISSIWIGSVPNLEDQIRQIEDRGYEVEVRVNPRDLTEAEVAGMLPGVRGLLVGNDHITARALEAADRLEVISRLGVGYNSINVDACTARGIPVCIAAGAGAPSVAEFTIGLALGLSRRIRDADHHIRNGVWGQSSLQGVSLMRKTLGIIGLGRIGKRVAEMSRRAFDTRVVYYDRIRDEDFERRVGVEFGSLDDVLRAADFVTIHVPLSPETRNLIGARELALMKQGAYLINTARGGIVDEQALVEALKAERLGGVALDVYEREPLPPDHPLVAFTDRVLLTSHLAGAGVEAKVATAQQAIDSLLAVLAGDRLPEEYVVNPQVLAAKGPVPPARR